MRYENIKGFNTRCKEHPDHQFGMISDEMLKDRLFEEIDELRAFIEQREWVGLTDADFDKEKFVDYNFMAGTRFAEAKLKEKNT